MKKVNPLKLTLVTIPLAIVLTFIIRYLVVIIMGNAMHPAFTLVVYIVLFAAIKMMAEKMVKQGKLPWLRSEEN